MVTLVDTRQRYKDYLEHERQLAAQTVVAYLNDISRLTASIGNKDVEAITLDDVRRHIREMSKDGLSPNTIRRRINSLSTFYKFLDLEGMATNDIIKRLHLPKKAQSKPTWLTDSELIRFVETPSRLTLAWVLMAWFGLRRAETLALQWNEIRLEDQLLLVRGKGDIQRFMPIPDRLIPYLRDEIHKRELPTGRVVPMGKTPFARAFTQHIKNCGLDGLGITPHSIRHTFASMLIHQGVDSSYIRDLMGHKDIKTTMGYIHLRKPRLIDAMDHHVLNSY